MPRTNAALVGEVIDVDPDVDLGPFIGYSNELVTELCTNSNYSDSRLTSIETWLAAHFYAMFDPQTKAESAGDVRVEYESKTGHGFQLSRQGQQALRLDTAGNLASLDNTLNVVRKRLPGKNSPVLWLGTDPCDS